MQDDVRREWFYHHERQDEPDMTLPSIPVPDGVVKQAYEDLAQGAMRKLGDTLAVIADRILNPRFKSAEERALDWNAGEEESRNRRRLAAEALDRVPVERRIFPAPQIAGPIFRNSEFELPETPVWELWRRLLSRACDNARVGEVHPAFPGIIGQLAVAEATILDAYRREQYPVLRMAADFNPSTGQRGHRWRVLASDVPQSMIALHMERLSQLGLVKESNLVNGLTIRTEQGELRLDSYSQHYPLTAFGALFLRAVIDPDENSAD